MRSKEVEDSINKTKQMQEAIKERGERFCFYDVKSAIIGYEILGITLNYISGLEEKCLNQTSIIANHINQSIEKDRKHQKELADLNEGWKQVIRDKINELEEQSEIQLQKNEGSLDYQIRQYNYTNCKITVLKELLGE